MTNSVNQFEKNTTGFANLLKGKKKEVGWTSFCLFAMTLLTLQTPGFLVPAVVTAILTILVQFRGFKKKWAVAILLVTYLISAPFFLYTTFAEEVTVGPDVQEEITITRDLNKQPLRTCLQSPISVYFG